MPVRETALISKDGAVRIPLKDIRIEVDVKDVAAMTTITQVYQNRETRVIEAVYCFPVEEGAAVCGFEIETDGQIIKGVAEEREKAFETYDRAIEAGAGAFLLDQEAEDIMVISVGNVRPEQEVTVRIRYVSELPVNDGVLRLQIPTTVSPRYAPPGADPEKVDRITPPYTMSAPYRLALQVRVLAETIGAITSPSHRITSRLEDGCTVVSLAEQTTALDRDFILELETAGRKSPLCLLASHESGDRTALFRFYPELDGLATAGIERAEVIFVLDCSGSMSGSSIDEAKQALELSLRSLSEGDLFNIVRFGSDYELYSKEPVVYNDSSLTKAVKYLRRISADLGGTELMAPMSYVCSLPERTRGIRDVLLLTDGEVSYPDEIIHMVRKAGRKMRVFTFGIGYGASHHLVRGVARAGGGASEMIQPGEKIQPKVLRQFSRMAQPFLTDVSVVFPGAEAQLPAQLPPLFDGDSYTLYARILGSQPVDRVTFKGTFLDREYTWSADVLDIGADSSIPSLWALSRIKQLEQGGIGGSNQGDRKRKRVQNEIRDLGLRYSLLTDYTSFVAVEERKADDKPTDRPEYRRVPVTLTRDWHAISGAPAESAMRLDFTQLSMTAPSKMKHSRELLSGLGGLGDLLSSAAGSIKAKTRSPRGKKGESTQHFQASYSYSEEEEPAEERSSAPAAEDWHFRVLGSQEAQGYFTALDAVALHLGVEVRELERIAADLDNVTGSTAPRFLTTWLAVRLLSRDDGVLALSRRAIRKAERWMAKICPSGTLTVKGQNLEEVLERELGVEI